MFDIITAPEYTYVHNYLHLTHLTEMNMNKFVLLANERIASIRDVQKNPSSALRGITRVTRGSKTIGFFLSNDEFADLIENQEALSSKAFIRQVAQGRRQVRAHKTTSLDTLAVEYGV